MFEKPSTLDESSTQPSALNRRTVLKGAAWAAPAISLSLAVPKAAASVDDLAYAWQGSATDLASLRVLDSSEVLGLSLLDSLIPTHIRVSNSGGPVTGVVTGVVTVAYSSGISVSLLGRPKGVGVYSVNSAVIPASSRQVTARDITVVIVVPITVPAPYTTVNSFTLPSSVPSGITDYPIEFGYTSQGSGLLSLSGLVTHTATMQIFVDGLEVFSGSQSLLLPLGGSLL